MNDADFDDILSILEKKEYSRANTTIFIDEDDEKEIEWIKEYPEEEKKEIEWIKEHPEEEKEEIEWIREYPEEEKEEIEWIREYPEEKEEEIAQIKESSEEGIEVDPFSKFFSPMATYFEVPKQEKKEVSSKEIEEIIEFFKRTSIPTESKTVSQSEDLRRGKVGGIVGRIGEYLVKKIEYFFMDEPEAVTVKLMISFLVVGSLVLNVMETSFRKQEEKERNNPTPKKEEYVTKNVTYKSNTTFTQKDDGTVTNVLDGDIYKEFSEYARSNDLVMNMENFQDFCDNYYENTSSRGGR